MPYLIKRKHRGEDVRKIQRELNTLAMLTYSVYPQLIEDGIFGTETERRVQEFQTFRQLKSDGIVGPQTWNALMHEPFPAPPPAATTAAAKPASPPSAPPEPPAAPSYSAFIESCQPRAGDFFLTASRTGANKNVRDWSGSTYGHAILFFGDVASRTVLFRSTGTKKTIPSTRRRDNAMELPLKLTSLDAILKKDEVFRLLYVGSDLHERQRKTLIDLAIAFFAAKYDPADKTSGYSSKAAIGYGLGDTVYENTVGSVLDLFPAGAADFMRSVPLGPNLARYGARAGNALLQSAVELYDGYPNLNCSSLVAWLYKQVGAPITRFSATTSPKDLHLAAFADRKRFRTREFFLPGAPENNL